ncbi:MAG: hypothetical protein AB1736_07320 [Chloroflexota bacterium]
MTLSRRVERRALAIAIVGPIAVIAMAYFLWWVSDRMLYVGPLDRAAFGWIAVMPTWWVSPAVAALLWRGLPSRVATGVATTIGVLLGAATVLLLWTSIGREMGACPNGPRTSPAESVLWMLLVGLAIGGGWATSALTASSMVRSGQVWRGFGAGIGVLVAVTFMTIVVASLLIMMYMGCNRPS